MTILAATVITIYAFRVLPAYLKKNPIDDTKPFTLRVLPTNQVIGSRGASKTIIEFGDIECPYCSIIDPQVVDLVKQHPDVRLVWKDCPLPSHPNAQKAAEAALCAGDQGKYWEYHNALVANNDQLGAGTYSTIASALKLNTDRFFKCLDSSAKRSQVLDSLNECALAGVEELPWFSFNGKTFFGSGIVSNLVNELNNQ